MKKRAQLYNLLPQLNRHGSIWYPGRGSQREVDSQRDGLPEEAPLRSVYGSSTSSDLRVAVYVAAAIPAE